MYPLCNPNRFDFIIRLKNTFLNNFLYWVNHWNIKILSSFNP